MKQTLFFHTSGTMAHCICALFALAALLVPGSVLADSSAENDQLAWLVRTALEQNSEIRAARSTVMESEEMIRQAGILPDPALAVEYFLEPVETRTGPQEASLALKQSIPWPGRLSLDRELKQRHTDIARSSLDQTRLRVIREVKERYTEYAYLGQAQQITAQILELMNYLEGVARTNYTSGKASYTDVLKIQIEIDRLKNRQESLIDNAVPVRIAINNLLNLGRDMALLQPSTIPEVSLDAELENVAQLAWQNNPLIRTGQFSIDRNRTSVDIARLTYFPDITMSIKTIFTGNAEFGDPPDSGHDPVIAGFSINLPIWFSKRNGAVAEKQAAVQTSRLKLQQTKNALDTAIEQLMFQYRESERLLELYNDKLIPRVLQEMDVAMEAFQGGQHSILELIDAERNWLNFELARVKAQADKARLIARLEELAGKTLAKWNTNTKQ